MKSQMSKYVQESYLVQYNTHLMCIDHVPSAMPRVVQVRNDDNIMPTNVNNNSNNK